MNLERVERFCQQGAADVSSAGFSQSLLPARCRQCCGSWKALMPLVRCIGPMNLGAPASLPAGYCEVLPARTPALAEKVGRLHGPNARQQCRAVFHEPYVFRVRASFESGGGPPHSTTLARWPKSPEPPPGFGVRRPCGALESPGRFMVMRAGKRIGAFHEPGSAGIPAGGLV